MPTEDVKKYRRGNIDRALYEKLYKPLKTGARDQENNSVNKVHRGMTVNVLL